MRVQSVGHRRGQVELPDLLVGYPLKAGQWDVGRVR
jgi:hypothetical protein